MEQNLERFLTAQKNDFEQAFSEIKAGQKQSHWMWYIFPQFAGLGFSSTSKIYAIKNITEAKEFLEHPILGNRLREITKELLRLDNIDAKSIFGYTDALKLKSCMTLFSKVDKHNDNVFNNVIEKYFAGEKDESTLRLIER